MRPMPHVTREPRAYGRTMAKNGHRLEVWGLRSGGWAAYCSCGWVAPLQPSRDEAVDQVQRHGASYRPTPTS